jgi:hypothetical protein
VPNFEFTDIIVGGIEQCRRMTITPEMAQMWILRNTNNRPVTRSKVDERRRDMELGRWAFTHQGIAFDRLGVLSDGQHRLLALSEMPPGFSVESYVFFNQDPEARKHMDIGNLRRMSDRTGYHKKAVEIMRVILATHIKHGITIEDFQRYYSEHQEAIDWTTSQWSASKGVGQSCIRAAFVELYEHSPSKASHCHEQLKTGAYLTPTDPMYHLRKLAIEGRNGKLIPKNELWNCARSAVRAVIENRPMKKIVGVKK